MGALITFFRNLTKPGLVNPETGETTYYKNDAKRAVAFAQPGMRPEVQPEAPDGVMARIPYQTVDGNVYLPDAQGNPAVAATNVPNVNGTEVVPEIVDRTTQVPQAPNPKFVKPTAREAMFDEYGNVSPKPKALTKAGILVSLLRGGLQGAADAAAGGALDAVPGRSSFGAGMQAAQVLPALRAQRAQAIQRGELENQKTQAEIATLPWLRKKQDLELQNMQSEMDYRKIHADYLRSAAAKKDQDTLQQLHAQAVQRAVSGGRDPLSDPDVQRYADAITSLQRQSAPRAENDFAVWRSQNPNASIEKYWDDKERAAHKYDKTPQTKPTSPALLTSIEARKGNALKALHNRWTWDNTIGAFKDKDNNYLSADEFQEHEQQIQDAYEGELASATGHPVEHFDYAAARSRAANKPRREDATQKAFNSKTGKSAYLIGNRWYTEDELQ